MAHYQILLPKPVEKQLDRLPVEVRDRLVQRISTLAEEPRPRGSVELKGKSEEYRIRVGAYRVRYKYATMKPQYYSCIANTEKMSTETDLALLESRYSSTSCNCKLPSSPSLQESPSGLFSVSQWRLCVSKIIEVEENAPSGDVFL